MSSNNNSNDKDEQADEKTGLLAATETQGRQTYRGDGPETWTISRRVALALSHFSWYSPHGSSSAATVRARSLPSSNSIDQQQGQQLQDAWAYFEHVVLPRHYVPEGVQGPSCLHKAKPGEARVPTQLYSVWETPEHDLADMGIGIGLYFTTLRALAWIFLLAGLLNFPILWFYYTRNSHSPSLSKWDWVLRATAVCTEQRWAPCPSCRAHDWDYFPPQYDRYAQTLPQQPTLPIHKKDDLSLHFIKVNACRFGGPHAPLLGWFSLASVILLAMCLYVFCFEVLQRKEAVFDENAQTSQDYSIRVENPPPDATNAEEWKAFFEQFGSENDQNVVACCTVALDNEVLVRAMVERRRLLIQLESSLKPGVQFNKHNLDHAVDNALEEEASWWSKLLFGKSEEAKDIREQIRQLDDEILLDLAKETYHVSSIFITFETEAAQRRALHALSLSHLAPIRNTLFGTSVLPEHLLFRGRHLLRVKEAAEPSAVRWAELDTTIWMQLTQRLATGTLTFLCGLGSMVGITVCRHHYGATVAGFVIAICNAVVPYICFGITNLESHTQEGTKSTSRYTKVSLWMFANTAIITSVITPFPSTVSNDPSAIPRSVYAIFIAELITGPFIQLLDPEGFVNRHVLGPRAKNFRRRLLLFRGTAWDLSDRYTNMTNVIFVTFYYAIIFPPGFLFAAASLFIHYWTDKWCLLRVWSQVPEEGTRISRLCKAFLMLSLLIYVVISAYAVSAFPYDNACEDTNATLPDPYVGNHTVYDFANEEYQISIPPDEIVYHFCDQDMLRYQPFPVFPPLPSKQPQGGEWMDGDQELITAVFGWASVGAILFVLMAMFHRIAFPFLRSLFQSHYKPTGKANAARFSDVKAIYAYVPQVKIEENIHPLVVCHMDSLDPELLGWNDSVWGNDYHNVLLDIPGLTGEDKPMVFSSVHHWPPCPQKAQGSDAG